MTDQEINIGIAKACGWTGNCDQCSQGIVDHFDGEGNFIGSGGCEKCQGGPIPMPDYCHDLNAMREAELTLQVQYDLKRKASEVGNYIHEIQEVVGGVPGCFSQYCASARQRAEAFLRTKGLWRD